MRGELSEYTAGGEGTFDRYHGGEFLIATYRTVHWRKLKLKPADSVKHAGWEFRQCATHAHSQWKWTRISPPII